MNKKSRSSAKSLTLMAIFVAVIFLQNEIPILGYLPIPPLNPTIIHVTVIVASIVLGTRAGAGIGLFWGLLRLFKAWTAPMTPLDPIIWTNPFITVLPRVLVGVVAGQTFKVLNKRVSFKKASAWSGALGSLTNTALVMGLIYLIYAEEYAAFLGIGQKALLGVIATTIFTNGLAEAVVAAILAPFLSEPLVKRLAKIQ